MKAREVIDSTTSEWHSVDAAQMASETYGQLDDDERDRLARRAYTEEWRAALRSKDSDGVPRYASIEITTPSGDSKRIYKQTALFSVADYQAAILYHQLEAGAHQRAARALTKRCNEIHGTVIPLPGMEMTA